MKRNKGEWPKFKNRKIPKKVLEQTQKGFERIERGEGITFNEVLRRLKKLREMDEKEPSQRKTKKKRG